MKKPFKLEVWIFPGTTHFVSRLLYIHPTIFTECITETYCRVVNASH